MTILNLSNPPSANPSRIVSWGWGSSKHKSITARPATGYTMVVLLNFWTCPYFNLPTFYTTITSTCVGDSLPRHDFVSKKKGRLNRMLPTCWAGIVDMLATDRNVCRLGGVADRHESDIASQGGCYSGRGWGGGAWGGTSSNRLASEWTTKNKKLKNTPLP